MEKKTITPGTRMRIAASRHMRQELARMKDHAKNLMDDGVETPDEYAIDRTRYAAEDAVYSVKGSAQSALRRLHRRRDMLQRREGAAFETPDMPETTTEPMAQPVTRPRRMRFQSNVYSTERSITPGRSDSPRAFSPAQVRREILAVYAVRTVNDPEHPQEVTSMTEEKTELLRDTFWQMNALSSRTETVEITPAAGHNGAEPGNGDNPGEPEDPNPENPAGPENPEASQVSIHLIIELTQKTPEDMAAQLSFSEAQRQQLSELLSEAYATLWNGVLYGIGTGDGEIVSVALSQVGNVGG